MYSSANLPRISHQEERSTLPLPVGDGRDPRKHHSFMFLVDHGASELDRMIVAVTARKLVPFAQVYIADASQAEIEDWEGIFYLPMYCGSVPRVGVVTTIAVFNDSSLAHKAAEAYPKAEVFLISHDLVLPDVLGCGQFRGGNAVNSHLGS